MGTPNGTVTFWDGGQELGGGPVTLVRGKATLITTALGAGSHSLTAVYAPATTPATNFAASTSTPALAPKVAADGTTTTVTATPGPATYGQSVTFTATVRAAAPGSGTPQGAVQFVVDGVNFGSPLALSGGVASVSDAALGAGSPHYHGHL